ncbi:MAG: sulfotransferase [Planctomycetota bacterium]
MSNRTNRAKRQRKKREQERRRQGAAPAASKAGTGGAAATASSPPDVEQALKASYDRIQKGQFERAEQVLRKALTKHPRHPRLSANLIAALENQGRAADALRVSAAVVEANPDDAQCRNNHGALLKFAGHLDEAREEFRRAVELAPDYASAWRNLAGLKTFDDPDDPDLTAMRALLEKVPRRDERKTALYFAVAAAYDQIGDVDEAFAHFERGNRHHRAGAPFRIDDVRSLFEDTIAHQTADLVQRGPVPGASDAAPILIVGMPRSGSTLVEQILASHPDAAGVGEVPDLVRTMQPYATDPRFRVRAIAALGDADIASIGRAYANSLERREPDAKRVVDKFLTNFVHLGTLRRALPNARFVYVRRRPMDCGFGCYRTLFTSNVPYTYALDDIAAVYAETERLMEHWRQVLPEALVEVDYEAIVADQEGETRRLLDAVGLEWSDACLRFHETERRVNSASSTQVRRPLYASAVGRWKPYERHLRPLAAAFQANGVEIEGDAAGA